VKGRIAALYRYPLKGFTPEPLKQVSLAAGAGFPGDRLFAVEDGPCGFDPAAPAHIPKVRFTVLAKIPEVARVRTRYDAATATLSAEAPNAAPISARLSESRGREAFAAWLSSVLGEQANGPLKVIEGPGGHRFYDYAAGWVSLINLASVRDLEAKIGVPLDPLRFRANVYAEGLPAWAELGGAGQSISLGPVRARISRDIPRCLATHANPATGDRDIDVLEALRREYGHVLCGVYLDVLSGGEVREGDALELAS
jgi:hypothetical protein